MLPDNKQTPGMLGRAVSEANDQPYALAKLEENARAVKQAINELPVLRKRLDKNKDNKTKARDIYGDLQQQYGRLIGTLNSAAFPLMEMDLHDMAEYSVKLSQSIKSFNLMTPDYTKLCVALNDYLSKLPVSNHPEMQTTNAAVIGRLMATVKMGYYPTDLDHVKHLSRSIEFPEGVTVNAFDPCCGCGLALRALADGNDCDTFGIELDGHRAEEALTRLDRVGFGSYFRSRISNEAFHMMLLNPPYLSVMTERGNNTRNEKRFLVDSITHLMYGGMMVYIIPHYRLTADICRVLCDNFDDITIWRFSGEEFKRYKQVAVMGIRSKRKDGSSLVSELASLVLTPHDLRDLSEIPENRYQLPAKVKKVDLFKGALFNVTELAEQLNKSTSFSRLFEKNKLDNIAKRPLLPLNLGQVGLIGGSGLINGLVECETPHIIKGRIVKENRINKEENLNRKGELMSTTLIETRSNKMIFNLLTPQGFMSLTDYATGSEYEDTDGDGYDNYAQTDETSATNDGLFPLGRMVVTANARGILSDADIHNSLALHHSGNWGKVSFNDYRANNKAVKNGTRIISAYVSNNGDKFWVITEADRSCTTVLMPDDY
jgi:hypothetical protein